MPTEVLEIFVPLAAFAFGAVVGSFLNVVIYRLPREEEGLSVTHPRLSMCPKCGETIRWHDNIPLLSYFLLGGRCRSCRATIPLRYFGVELLTGCLFALSAWVAVVVPLAAGAAPQWGLMVVWAALLASMVAVTFIDLDHQIIPDRIDKPGMVAAVIASGLLPELHVAGLPAYDLELIARLVRVFGVDAASGLGVASPHLASLLSCGLGMACGAGVIYGIGVLGKLVFRKEAMGFGDVKYMGMLGGFLGWPDVLLALLVACLAGALIGIAVKLLARSSYIPFGPFLSLGALCVLFWSAEIRWVIFVWYPSLLRG